MYQVEKEIGTKNKNLAWDLGRILWEPKKNVFGRNSGINNIGNSEQKKKKNRETASVAIINVRGYGA